MSANASNARNYTDIVARKAPEYFDLLTTTDEAEFEKAFDAILGRVISRLEENKKNYQCLDEVGLTSVLGIGLSIPGLSISPEKHSNGHVDLVIEADHCTPVRKKLAEAKIWDGYDYHVSGLAQLIDRYSTGREGRSLLVTYFKNHKGVAMLVRRLRETMDEKLPCQQQGKTSNHVHTWSFLSIHLHNSGANLEVSHVACNLYVDASATR